MDKFITTDMIISLCKDFGLDPDVVKAVIIVEAGNSGFDQRSGLVKIQFEPGYFEHYERTKILNGVEDQPQEWEAFNKAAQINLEHAMMSTSWGMGQIMGANHNDAGYKSVHAMVNDFKASEYYQLKGMLTFISNNKMMFTALKFKNWEVFASLYNGKQYKKFNYVPRLEKAYKTVKK
jgi:hypothetical protein